MSLFCNYIQRKVFSFAAFLICRLSLSYFESWEMIKIKISIGPNLVLLFWFWNGSRPAGVCQLILFLLLPKY